MINVVEKCNKAYYTEYKVGFRKKYYVHLFIYDSYIKCAGFNVLHDQITGYSDIKILLKNIKEVNLSTFDNKDCLIIKYRSESLAGLNTKEIYLLGFENPIQCKDNIMASIQKHKNYLQEQEKIQREIQAENERQEQKSIEFYQNCYNFHIKKNTPNYELYKDKNVISAIYIDEHKGINFLKIDGNAKEETVAVIPYSKIHYYERAGNIHYVSDTSGTYSSVNGSFTGSTFSKPAAAIGGLLFGTLGMAVGTLFSYKQSVYKQPDTSFEISSEVKKIDDRNIILNFFSDEKQQYIDLELPQEMYNFLQTFLPDKKYAIVTELEKQNAIYRNKSNQNLLDATETQKLIEEERSTLDVFKIKAEKLKIMHEAGLLSDEEFNLEKSNLLSQI